MPLWKLADGIHVGNILKPHSYLGSVRVAFFISGLEGILQPGAFLFVEWNEKPVPYYIEEVNWTSERTAIIHFADIVSEEAAQKLKGRNLILPESDLPEGAMEEIEENVLEGYSVIDVLGTFIGKVTGIVESEMQDLLEVEHHGKEILIPFHQDIVLKIDHRKKQLTVNPPDGLFDL